MQKSHAAADALLARCASVRACPGMNNASLLPLLAIIIQPRFNKNRILRLTANYLLQGIIASLPRLEIMNIHVSLLEISAMNSNSQSRIPIKPLVRSLFSQFPKLCLLFCGNKDWFQTYVKCNGTAQFAVVRSSTAKYYLPQKEQIEWYFTPDVQNYS